jgi:hypothetical protein
MSNWYGSQGSSNDGTGTVTIVKNSTDLKKDSLILTRAVDILNSAKALASNIYPGSVLYICP